MKLAISNIAWTNEEEADIAVLLKDLGVKYIELAPTKKWPDPTRASNEEVLEYKQFWNLHGIEIVAFQSMLFSRPDLKIFESDANRDETSKYLADFIGLASKIGAGVMVFGSPKNRQRGELDEQSASVIAERFFGELGAIAQQNDVRFCIEPNAPQYACDFVTNAEQGIKIVDKVGLPGFGLHLDTACMALAGDDFRRSITDAASLLEHFHISSPMLEAVKGRDDVNHSEAASALRDIGYSKFVSIEMRPMADGNAARVEEAVRFAQSIYGS